MEANIAKVLDRDSSPSVLVKVKRKHAAEVSDAGCMILPSGNLSFQKFPKRRKVDGCKSNSAECCCPFRRTVGWCYSNFMKSGLPQRLMFYENGQWMDFPQTVICFVQEDLRMKKATIEVNRSGYHFLLDFVHMCQLDLETGLQKPIAWIDEAGGCFFPELSVNEGCQHACAENQDVTCKSCYRPRELKLQIEVDLTGVYDNKLMECSGESDTPDKKMPESAINHKFAEYEDSHNREVDVKVHQNLEVNHQRKAAFTLCYSPTCEKLEFDSVWKMLLAGMSGVSLEIVGFNPCSSALLQARFELFQKQAEITKKYRGNANVQYAWLATSEGALSTLATYGLGFYEVPTVKPIFGSGIQLAAANCSRISAKYCDVDEKGIQHMLFCRVILGKTELVQPGCTQCHPSSEEFDSGVDDIQNPTRFMVWTMNMTTHIFPEYIVSFKVPSSAEGNIVGSHCLIDSSSISVKGSDGDVQEPSAVHSGCSSNPGIVDVGIRGKAPGMASAAPRVPRSPWMSFPMLLATISDKVTPEDMHIVNYHYDLFKARHITRDEFVKKLRMVVGDRLLRSTINGTQCKIP